MADDGRYGMAEIIPREGSLYSLSEAGVADGMDEFVFMNYKQPYKIEDITKGVPYLDNKNKTVDLYLLRQLGLAGGAIGIGSGMFGGMDEAEASGFTLSKSVKEMSKILKHNWKSYPYTDHWLKGGGRQYKKLLDSDKYTLDHYVDNAALEDLHNMRGRLADDEVYRDRAFQLLPNLDSPVSVFRGIPDRIDDFYGTRIGEIMRGMKAYPGQELLSTSFSPLVAMNFADMPGLGWRN